MLDECDKDRNRRFSPEGGWNRRFIPAGISFYGCVPGSFDYFLIVDESGDSHVNVAIEFVQRGGEDRRVVPIYQIIPLARSAHTDEVEFAMRRSRLRIAISESHFILSIVVNGKPYVARLYHPGSWLVQRTVSRPVGSP